MYSIVQLGVEIPLLFDRYLVSCTLSVMKFQISDSTENFLTLSGIDVILNVYIMLIQGKD